MSDKVPEEGFVLRVVELHIAQSIIINKPSNTWYSLPKHKGENL